MKILIGPAQPKIKNMVDLVIQERSICNLPIAYQIIRQKQAKLTDSVTIGQCKKKLEHYRWMFWLQHHHVFQIDHVGWGGEYPGIKPLEEKFGRFQTSAPLIFPDLRQRHIFVGQPSKNEKIQQEKRSKAWQRQNQKEGKRRKKGTQM